MISMWWLLLVIPAIGVGVFVGVCFTMEYWFIKHDMDDYSEGYYAGVFAQEKDHTIAETLRKDMAQ